MRLATRILRVFAGTLLAIVALGPLSMIVLMTVVLPVAGWFILGEGRFMGTTFTPAAWAEAGSCAGLTDSQCDQKWMRCPRGGMLRSLTRDHLRIGKLRRDEAIALLGSRFWGRKDGSCIEYRLGQCSLFAFGEQDILTLCFDESNLLISSRRRQT
jgi:hypothetical protein